jgi:uncharacterized protein YcfL
MKQLALFLSVLALVVASGCARGGAYEPVNTAKYNQEDSSKFVVFDAGAQRSVTCSQMQLGRTADGRVKVAANLRNRINRRIEVQAKCVFKDAQGFAVDETPFRTVFLDENATETISFESFSKDATNYTIRVRQAR